MRELDLPDAAAALRGGGVIAYPTEAVFGLGCDPSNQAAVAQLLRLKRRPKQKGLICIASSFAQIEPWLDLRHSDDIERAKATWPGPITWVLRAKQAAPSAIGREDGTVAVRVTAHQRAAALCNAFGGAVVSTSANPAGAPPARDPATLTHYFGNRISGVLTGGLGGSARPSQIFDGRSGEPLRA